MKEITEEYLEEKIKNIDKIIAEKGELTFTIFDKEIKYPKFILDCQLKNFKSYEFEDVKDVKNNYPFLEELRKDPLKYPLLLRLKYFVWSYRVLLPILRKIPVEELKSFVEGNNEILNILGENINENKVNHKICTLDNVYLNNFEFIKHREFEACEFDISDKYDDLVRGVFFYRLRLYSKYDGKEELEKLIDSSSNTTFDIYFEAITENVIDKKNGKKIGKKLHVNNIHRLSENDEELEIRSPLNSLVHVF